MVAPLTRTEPAAQPRPAMWRRGVALLLKATLPLAIVAVGTYGAMQVMATAPDASRRPPTRDARLVEIAPARLATEPPLVEAWGEVEPSRLAVIRPQVAGRVEYIHSDLTEGGRIPAGTDLIRLDASDYELALRRAESDLAKVEAEIAIERGNQAVARREYQLLGRQLKPEEEALVLRQPQLASLEADKASAEAAIAAAELDVARTTLKAPFPAIVLSENVDVGTALSAGSEAATLVGSETFHVVVALPPGALDWIDFPAPGHEGAEVHLYDAAVWGSEVYRVGRVVRLSASLTSTGRMSEVVISLDDPLAQETEGVPPVLLGSFLRAEIAGRPIEGAVEIDRASLRDNDTVWVMSPEGTLEIRKVAVAWRGTDRVLLTAGLEPGEQVVTSLLTTVAEGMALRLRDQPAPSPAVAGSGGE